MSEYKLFEGDVPEVSTAAFHAHRERAPHLEQPIHRQRIDQAERFIVRAVHEIMSAGRIDVKVSDLGCGDGGLLSRVQRYPSVQAWGYDFQPSNAAGWEERGVHAHCIDAFGRDERLVEYGDITVMTEVLEHLANPHQVVGQVFSEWLVASSPWDEDDRSHDECHAWAWDMPGYRALIEQGGYRVLDHVQLPFKFQVILGRRP